MAIETKKIKKDYFEIIREAMSDNEEIVTFCDNEIALLDNRSTKARERAQSKKNEIDSLKETVLSMLTDEYQSTADITCLIDDEDVTPNKVVYRLNRLVEDGKAVKAEATVENEEGKSHKIKVFKLAE